MSLMLAAAIGLGAAGLGAGSFISGKPMRDMGYVKAAGRFSEYNRQGLAFSMGAFPYAQMDGQLINEFHGKLARGVVADPMLPLLLHNRGMQAPTGGWSGLGMGMTIGASAASLALGVHEGGLSGGFQAGMMDIAVNAAVYRKAMTPAIQKAGVTGAINAPSYLRVLPRLLGSFAGAQTGWDVGGYPGMYLGAVAGASGKVWLAGLGVAAAGSVMKGGYNVMKMGNERRQRQKVVETAGDLSAFMTQGAMTMRSRAVQAIHKSHLNARSGLGMEAGYLSMPSRNYHSRYRTSY